MQLILLKYKIRILFVSYHFENILSTEIERKGRMEDYFLLKSLSHALIALLMGIILTFTDLVYIAMHIYVPGYSLLIPIILTVIGVILIIWSCYRLVVMGRDNER